MGWNGNTSDFRWLEERTTWNVMSYGGERNRAEPKALDPWWGWISVFPILDAYQYLPCLCSYSIFTKILCSDDGSFCALYISPRPFLLKSVVSCIKDMAVGVYTVACLACEDADWSCVQSPEQRLSRKWFCSQMWCRCITRNCIRSLYLSVFARLWNGHNII